MINEQVRDREVRVISSNGEQLGIMSSKEAMKLARLLIMENIDMSLPVKKRKQRKNRRQLM